MNFRLQIVWALASLLVGTLCIGFNEQEGSPKSQEKSTSVELRLQAARSENTFRGTDLSRFRDLGFKRLKEAGVDTKRLDKEVWEDTSLVYPCPPPRMCDNGQTMMQIAASRIEEIAAARDIASKVSLQTKEKAGATIKMQLVGDRSHHLNNILTAKKPSQCEETIRIGIYYIWAERDGEKTSDAGAEFQIVEEKEAVVLTEWTKPKAN
jgi:hypothetical protein